MEGSSISGCFVKSSSSGLGFAMGTATLPNFNIYNNKCFGSAVGDEGDGGICTTSSSVTVGLNSTNVYNNWFATYGGGIANCGNVNLTDINVYNNHDDTIGIEVYHNGSAFNIRQ